MYICVSLSMHITLNFKRTIRNEKKFLHRDAKKNNEMVAQFYFLFHVNFFRSVQ